MSLAIAALKSARVYLNDINAITWSDSILMPILQEAHGELVQELERFSLPVIFNQSAVIFVPAFAINLGANQPLLLVEPLSVMERVPGSDMDSFIDMTQVTFIPLEDQTQELRWWAWLGQVITFLGATDDREIMLRFKGSLATPQVLTDPLGFIFAERYMGPRIASIAMDAIGRDGSKFQTLAEAQLYKVVQSNVTSDQRPTRRRAYRSPKGFYGPEGGSVIASTTVTGGTTMHWILTSTPPDGARITFTFPKKPIYISWNGMNQFEGVGYTVVPVGATWVVSFRDVFGNPLIPGQYDDIREAA